MRKVELSIIMNLARSNRSFWELLGLNRFTLSEFMQALVNLYDKGLIKVLDDGEISATDRAIEHIDRRANIFVSGACNECNGKGLKFSDSFIEVYKLYKEAVRDRPKPKLEYFQGYMREYDVIARIALMHNFGDLINKKLIFVGDDDLVSVAAAMTHLPSRIFVLDADRRLGEFISKINNDYGLDIEFREYNVSDPLPEDLLYGFDVFSSEPLESLSGLYAFINRGIGSLREGGCGYFGLTTLEASNKKWLKIERMLLSNNCVITDIIRDFSRYPMRYPGINYEKFVERLPFKVSENKSIDWYRSSLIRFEVIGRRERSRFMKRLHVDLFDPNEDITYPKSTDH